MTEKETQKTPLKRTIRRVVMFLMFIASVLLMQIYPPAYNLVAFAVILGIIVWPLMGRLAVPIINKILMIPTKAMMGKQLYLLASKPPEKHTFFGRLFAVTDDTILPTLFMFGISNYFLNSGITLDKPVFSIFIVLLAPILGFIIPVLQVLLDSDLIRFKPADRLLEPVGRQYLLYLRGIAGYTAVVSFFYSIFQLASSASPDDALGIILLAVAAFIMAYTEIYIVVFVYSYVHPKFVKKLNDELRETYTYLEVTAVESLERGYIEFSKVQ